MKPFQNQKSSMSSGFFSREDLNAIHESTMEVLATQGVVFDSPEAIAILQDHGAFLEAGSRCVRFPRQLVEKALSSVPSFCLLAGRDPAADYVLSGYEHGYTTFGVGFSVIDCETGVLRDSSKRDLIESAILADYLATVDIYTHAVTARDCPIKSIDLHEAKTFFTHTVKHCMHVNLTHRENVRRFIQMAGLLVDGKENLHQRPVTSALICPQSPLVFPRECCDIIIELARVGLPVNILPMAIASQTAPATIAGTAVINNAEVLAGLVLSQLTMAGAPVIYGCSSTCFDFVYSTTPVGSPSLALCSATAVAMAHHYAIPCYVAGT